MEKYRQKGKGYASRKPPFPIIPVCQFSFVVEAELVQKRFHRLGQNILHRNFLVDIFHADIGADFKERPDNLLKWRLKIYEYFI